MNIELHSKSDSLLDKADSALEMSRNHAGIILLIGSWVERQATTEQQAWLNLKLAKIKSGDAQSLYLSFGQVTRKFSKVHLELTEDDLKNAQQLRTNWRPQFWTLDQLVRSLMALSLTVDSPDKYLQVIDKLFATGEVQELIALYQTLPIFPIPELLVPRATEGIRTNMQVVFSAVAHHNPFPANYLDEMSFNQMVLKAIFVGVPLYKIVGQEDRANAALSKMLCDYAKERWAAKRTITPELWRNVGRYADDRGLLCIQRVIAEGTPLEVEAGHLALVDAGKYPGKTSTPHNWDDLGRRVEATLGK
jgi:hypothetical protein